MNLAEAEAYIASLGKEGLAKLDHLLGPVLSEIRWNWKAWARPNQMPPEGDWLTWLVLAGRGFGKTRCGAEWVRAEVTAKRATRIALIAETQKDLEEVMVFGQSGLQSVFPPHQKPKITKKPIRIEFHTGAIANGYNATEPDQLRGPQFDCAWGDEMAKWRYARETWDQLQFGLRLGLHPRQIITTTPRPIPILKEILASPTTVLSRGVTTDNEANLAASFIKSIMDKYAGTRLGRQELSAEILDDVPDALWTRTALDRDRRNQNQIPVLKRVVVAIDPAAKKNVQPEEGAATGIIVAAVGEDNRGYILDDATCRESPNGWARMAVAMFDRYEGNCIVGEINNGGEMVQRSRSRRFMPPRVNGPGPNRLLHFTNKAASRMSEPLRHWKMKWSISVRTGWSANYPRTGSTRWSGR
jgi:phage terminase large subunit-like protein